MSQHQYHMTSSIADVKVKLETSILPAFAKELEYIQRNIKEFSTTASKLTSNRQSLIQHFDNLETFINHCISEMMEFLQILRRNENEARQMLQTCYKSEKMEESDESYDNNIFSHEPRMPHFAPLRMAPPCLPVTNVETTNDLCLVQKLLSYGVQVLDFRVTDNFQCNIFVENIISNGNDTAWISKIGMVSLLTSSGERIKSINAPNLNTLYFAIDHRDDLLYSNIETCNLMKITKHGHEIVLFETAPFQPSGLYIKNKSELLVCMQTHTYGKVVLYSIRPLREGNVIKEYVSHPDGSYLFHKPNKAVININEDICVIDTQGNKIVTITGEGTFKFEYRGPRNQSFEPIGIACDQCGNILVSDYSSKVIVLLNANGAHLTSFDLPMYGISRPMGLSVDTEGRLWIGQGNGRVHVARYLKKP